MWDRSSLGKELGNTGWVSSSQQGPWATSFWDKGFLWGVEGIIPTKGPRLAHIGK